MAVVDADYNFLYADIGCQGRISDGRVFRNTSFYKKLEENTLEITPTENLDGMEKNIVCIFMADDAFPLINNIMKSYSGSQEKGSI